jgi:hypothetical protein
VKSKYHPTKGCFFEFNKIPAGRDDLGDSFMGRLNVCTQYTFDGTNGFDISDLEKLGRLKDCLVEQVEFFLSALKKIEPKNMKVEDAK